MPFSSVLGAQSVVKPGVCTSATRPASPYDGQVVYLTDTDQTLVWDGTAWTVLAPIAGGRNVIINGAMQVAQRGTSSTGLGTAGGYFTADRWNFSVGQAFSTGRFTQSIENDAPTGSGFRKSLKLLITTASTLAAADRAIMQQSIEGQNVQQFLKGTSSAKQFSVSFWVKSNLTGTYIAELVDVDNTRQVSASYTISASGTWEKKTITFPADTTGVLDNDAETSLRLNFSVASGTNFTSGTLNTTWASTTNTNRDVGQVNLLATLNNYWQITGVQLEAGVVATPFEFEDYSETLAKCQRYYCKTGTSGSYIANGLAYSTTQGIVRVNFPVSMRVAPSAVSTSSTASHYEMVRIQTAQTACSALPSFNNSNTESAALICTIGAADLTQGAATFLVSMGGNGFLAFSAEL